VLLWYHRSPTALSSLFVIGEFFLGKKPHSNHSALLVQGQTYDGK
jgi:hypothetical protein